MKPDPLVSLQANQNYARLVRDKLRNFAAQLERGEELSDIDLIRLVEANQFLDGVEADTIRASAERKP